MPFAEAAARIDAAGVAFVEGVSTNLDYTLSGQALADVKDRLAQLGLRVAAYRIESIPSDDASRRSCWTSCKRPRNRADADASGDAICPASTVAVEDARGVYKQGEKTLGANLRDAARAAPLLLDLSRQQPPERPEWPNKCGDCATSRPSVTAAVLHDQSWRRRELRQGRPRGARVSRQRDLAHAADHDHRQDSARTNNRRSTRPCRGRRWRSPGSARKLLILDVCPAGGFYHTTIAHGNLMLQLIAKYTGAYEPVFDNNLDNLKYPRIRQYDAVFLNSVVGPVFSDPEVLDGLIRYVREGGGVAGLHGTTFASQDRARVRRADGRAGRSAPVQRRAGHAEDRRSASPLTKHFGGKGFSMMDEFYHFPPTGPYTREKLHVLLSVDADKTDLKRWEILRPDHDLRHGVDQDRRKGARLQQRARAPAGVLHDARTW